MPSVKGVLVAIAVIVAAIVIGVALWIHASQVQPQPKKTTLVSALVTETKTLCAQGGEWKVCIDYKIIRTKNATYIEIKDAVNRTVRVKLPVKRIVILFYPQLYLAILGVKDFPKYVVGWRAASWKQYRYDYYTYFLHYMPKIANIPDVGDLYRGTFDPEKTISLKPDVVFADVSQYRFYSELKKVEAAGIPVVFIDHGKTLLGPVKSILILGVLLNRTERAVRIADWILDKLWLVFSRLDEVKRLGLWRKYKVFLERGYRLWYTQGRYGWGEILYDLGAINIAEGKVPRIGEIQPEYVISQNPDIWVITCSWWVKRPNTPLCGVNVTNKTLIIERAIRFIKMHKGMEETKAVREGNVWLIYHDLDHNFNFFGYILLAKILYPEVYKDINATAIINEFFTKFIGVPFKGTWILHIDKSILERYGIVTG